MRFRYRHIQQILITALGITALAAILFVFAFIFTRPVTNIFGHSFINPFITFVKSIPIWMYIALCLACLSLLNAIILIMISSIYNLKRRRTNKLKQKYYHFFAYTLSNYIFSDYYQIERNRIKLQHRIKTHFKTTAQISIFIEVTLKMENILSVQMDKHFIELINSLDLIEKIKTQYHHINFSHKILSIKMLAFLRNHSFDYELIKDAENKNSAIRIEVYAAIIWLIENENDRQMIKFIGKKYELSMLEINIIVNAILINNKIDFDYVGHITTKKRQDIITSLILIRYLPPRNTNRVIELICHLLGNSNPEINKLAWKALPIICTESRVSHIVIEKFENQSDDVKLVILKGLKNIKSKELYDFFNNIIYLQSLEVKIETLKFIFNNDFNALAMYDGSNDKEINMAYEEISCVYN